MATPKLHDSGHHAIAGFLYQLLATGVEAFEIRSERPSNDDMDELLLLCEAFGQDAATQSTDSQAPSRLIQYKYSGTGSELRPSDLLAILRSFLKSARALGREPHLVEYQLVTNRPKSPDAKNWHSADVETLKSLIQQSSTTHVEAVTDLATIFRRLVYLERSPEALQETIRQVARALGMLDDEVTVGIGRLIGWLVQKAGEKGQRIVRREEIDFTLAGYRNPCQLLSEQSRMSRHSAVADYRGRETGTFVTIRREVAEEIARSALQYPVTVVVGKGGCGKTVAVCDAIEIGIADPTVPPGFGLVMSAIQAKPSEVTKKIAYWRNALHEDDGQDHERAFQRLKGVFADRPLLAIGIDAIDEKDGTARLPPDSEDFIRKLMFNAIQDYKTSGQPVTSIIVTCRSEEDLQILDRSGFGLECTPNVVIVQSFDDGELTDLMVRQEIDERVRKRVMSRITSPWADVTDSRSHAIAPVPEAFVELIRQPVLWRIFSSQLSNQQQYDCLEENSLALDELFGRYLDWFCRKAETRLRVLARNECRTVLLAAARRFKLDPARVGALYVDWLAPGIAQGYQERNVREIFEECLSAGIVDDVERSGKRWRWRHTLFCEYLIRSEEKE